MSEHFDKKWRNESKVERCNIRVVDKFIQAHYLKKRPAIVPLCLVASNGFNFGCAIFAYPPREVSKRYGGLTWELARLYLLDNIPKNAESWLIGQSVKFIKKNFPEVEYLISYADPTAGHDGTIYRASNWIPDGKTDDERKTPRCDYMDANGKTYSRRSHIPLGVEFVRKRRVSKFRFFLKLKRNCGHSAPADNNASDNIRVVKVNRLNAGKRDHGSLASSQLTVGSSFNVMCSKY